MRITAGLIIAFAIASTVGSAIAAPPLDLQARIGAAEPGETITVPPGTYTGRFVIDRPLILVADGNVVLEGAGEGDVLEITAPDVTVRGFTIRGTGTSLDRENAGIVVTAPRATLEDLHLDDVLFGMYLKEAPGSIIRRNRIGSKPLPEPRRGDAIRLWQSADCVIEDNVVHGSRDVITWFSNNVMLRRNKVTGGRYGMHFMYSSSNMLEDNVLTDNSVGAFLMYSRDLTLRRNVFARNRGPSGFGIGLNDLEGLVAEDNLIVGNDVGLGFLPNVRRNRFNENSFIDNVEQVSILGAGTLKDNEFVVDGRGNYWSDYRGFDLDGDGIGDTRYQANAFFENLIDRQPRMRLFLYSPAQHALEMAARAFPVVAPRPRSPTMPR